MPASTPPALVSRCLSSTSTALTGSCSSPSPTWAPRTSRVHPALRTYYKLFVRLHRLGGDRPLASWPVWLRAARARPHAIRGPSDPGPVIEMPDGSRHQAYRHMDGASSHFITKDWWTYERRFPFPVLRLPNGVEYTFGHQMRAGIQEQLAVTRIEDHLRQPRDFRVRSPARAPGCDRSGGAAHQLLPDPGDHFHFRPDPAPRGGR